MTDMNRENRRKYRREYYQRNKEHIREYGRKYRERIGKLLPSKKHICPICKREFFTSRSRKIYCSKDCRDKAQHKRNYKHILSEYRIRKSLPPKKHICPICKKEFIIPYGNQIYCSKYCRDKAYDKRNYKPHGILFDGINYKPKNELELVFLFSKFHKEIGFPKIIQLRSYRFPDCIAIDNQGKEVSIEFEYVSSHYIKHNHHKEKHQADHIICWAHDKKYMKKSDIKKLEKINIISLKEWIEERK